MTKTRLVARGLSLVACMLFIFGQSYAQAPANDTLCSATLITVDASCNGVSNGDNTNATAEINEPVPACFTGGANSVWFKFAGPASGLVSVSTDFAIGTNTDTEIALYALPAGNCNDLTDLIEIACDQDGGNL
ncbi:MAG: hypothetical protein AAF206_26425, partial [Bacteroidota bacterium]